MKFTYLPYAVSRETLAERNRIVAVLELSANADRHHCIMVARIMNIDLKKNPKNQ